MKKWCFSIESNAHCHYSIPTQKSANIPNNACESNHYRTQSRICQTGSVGCYWSTLAYWEWLISRLAPPPQAAFWLTWKSTAPSHTAPKATMWHFLPACLVLGMLNKRLKNIINLDKNNGKARLKRCARKN